MEIITLAPDAAKPVSRFGSRFSILHLLRTTQSVQAAVAYLEAGGLIGRHRAVENQLLVVTGGAGWVSGEDGVRQPVGVGQAAFWTAGEEHETGSDHGLTAMLLEGAGVQPLDSAV